MDGGVANLIATFCIPHAKDLSMLVMETGGTPDGLELIDEYQTYQPLQDIGHNLIRKVTELQPEPGNRKNKSMILAECIHYGEINNCSER